MLNRFRDWFPRYARTVSDPAPRVLEPALPQSAAASPARRPVWSAAMSVGLVLGVAILLRALVLIAVWDSPILYLHHWSETDNAFNDLWARKIVAGDVLSVDDVRPVHSWHRHVARAAFEASGGRAPLGESAVRRIWDEWLGPRTFYQDPLYPYFVAAIYGVFGRHVRAVFLAQAVLGLLSITLLWGIARRLGGEPVALVAGLMGALYGPLILYEDVLLRAVLINATGIATLWLATRAFRLPSSRRFALAGFAGALSVLATSSAWLFVLVVAALTPIALRRNRRQALRALGALAVGLLIGLTPVIARNLAVGVAPFSLASSGAITFVNHNAVDFQPMGGTAMSAYAGQVMHRSGGRMLSAIVETLHTHPDIGSWLALLGRKFLAVWRWYEIPNNESYDYFLLHARALRAVGLSFGVMAPLALVGLLLAFRRSWEYALTVAYVACALMSLVVLYTLGRLRMPMAFALIPFAAITVVTLARLLAARTFRRALVVLAAVAILATAVGGPLPVGFSRVRVQDYGVANQITLRLAEQRMAADDLRGALRLLTRQLETEPRELQLLEPSEFASTISRLAADLAGSFAPLHAMRSDLLAQVFQRSESERERRRAVVLATVAKQRANAR
jgi:4-amino-4-deoxy-L-arabinose transferase-like glycosyltransferase